MRRGGPYALSRQPTDPAAGSGRRVGNSPDWCKSLTHRRRYRRMRAKRPEVLLQAFDRLAGQLQREPPCIQQIFAGRCTESQLFHAGITRAHPDMHPDADLRCCISSRSSEKEKNMSYRDHDYISPTGTHPVGAHGSTGGSGWGLAIVLVVLVGILVLGIMSGPTGETTGSGAGAPMLEQSVPATDPAAPGAAVDTAPAPAPAID